MPRNTRVAVALAVVFAGSLGLASAGPIGDTGQFNQRRHAGTFSGGGGEFMVYAYGTGLSNAGYSPDASNIGSFDPSFQTFCIETDEFTGGDPTYFVVNDKAVAGGAGGPDPDPISKGTTWLYSQFAVGTLSGYNYTIGSLREAQAGLLQNALWMLEEEIAGSLANPYYSAAVTHFGSEAAAKANALSGEFGVYVLNTYGTKNAVTGELSNKRQDFLYAVSVPDGGTTAALLGSIFMAIAAVRRRMN